MWKMSKGHFRIEKPQLSTVLFTPPGGKHLWSETVPNSHLGFILEGLSWFPLLILD